MKLYKITDKNSQSRNNTQWGEGVTHQIEWSGEMCQEGCLHAYRGPYSAAMFAKAHTVNHTDLQLWEAEGEILLDDGTKVGVKRLTTLKRVEPIPIPTPVQTQAFAILCAMETPTAKENKEWMEWAKNWLNGTDRSYSTACRAWYTTLMVTPTGTATPTTTWMGASTVTQCSYRETLGEIDIEAIAKKAMTEF